MKFNQIAPVSLFILVSQALFFPRNYNATLTENLTLNATANTATVANGTTAVTTIW